MCLLTRQICPIKARKSIVVYKLLWMDNAKKQFISNSMDIYKNWT